MKNKLLIAVLIAIVFIGGFYFIRGNAGYSVITGNVVLDISTSTNKQFEIFDIEKSSNTVLETNIKTSKTSNVFVETDDCVYWKQGNDRDSSVLLAFPVDKEITYNIGNPSDNTQQQIELYKANELCLIVINKESGSNEISIKATEKDKDRWDIIE